MTDANKTAATPKPKKSETLEVRLPFDTKREFLDACREDGTTASEVVRGSIQTYLDGREQPTPQPVTGRLLHMIPQPIRKKRYLAGAVGAVGIAMFAAMPVAAGPDFKSVFASLDRNGDGVLSADEFGGGPGGPDDKTVVIERRIVKEADGTTTETETVSPAGAGANGKAVGKTVRIERIEKRTGTPEDAAKAGKDRKVTDEAVAYWLPDAAAAGAAPDGQRLMISQHREVSVHGDDPDAALTVDAHPNPFSGFDSDHDGKVSYAEFQAAHTAMLARGFDKLDANGDKTLSAEEYARIGNPPVMAPGAEVGDRIDMGMPALSPEQLKTAFTKLDQDGNSKLSLQEYMPPA